MTKAKQTVKIVKVTYADGELASIACRSLDTAQLLALYETVDWDAHVPAPLVGVALELHSAESVAL